MSEPLRRKAWGKAFTNTKLEYPDWQPEEEYLELIEKYIKSEMTIDEIIQILKDKEKVKGNEN